MVPPGEIDDQLARTVKDTECAGGNGIDPCNLQAGDIMLWRSTGHNALVESVATGHAYYSHASMVVGRWTLAANGPEANHLSVMVADITPGHGTDASPEPDLGIQAFQDTDAGGSDTDAHPAGFVFRPSATRSAASRRPGSRLQKILDEGASDVEP